MERTILHLDLDTFFVSVERLSDKRLEERPILVGGTGDRGVVSACSYETRPFGIHSGMSMKMARRLCPEAVVIRGEASTYTRYSRMVTDIIRERVPVFEKTSIDEFYADMSGMDRFLGCYQYCKELRERVTRETGLPISFGLSVNKVVSKIATGEAKPNNERKVNLGEEKRFLAPLSVQKIPMVGEKMFRILCDLGIRRVETVQQMPPEMMESVLGKNGILLWQRSNGIDNSPVIPFHERKSVSNERTFGRDTTDVARLRGIIRAMAENLAYQLRRGGKLTGCVSVKIRYADFNTFSKQVKIPYTASDHCLIPCAERLFEQLYNRRMLVRLVGVSFSDLVSGSHQFHLFDDNEERLHLYRAMDAIRDRYGFTQNGAPAVTWGAHVEVRGIGSLGNPFNGEPPVVPAHRIQ